MEPIYIWHPIKVNHALSELCRFYIYSLHEIFSPVQIGNFVILSFKHLIGHSMNTSIVGFILSVCQFGPYLSWLFHWINNTLLNTYLVENHSLSSNQEFISQAISKGWSTIVMWPDLKRVHFEMNYPYSFIMR